MTRKRFALIPIWLLTKALLPFVRKDHPWRGCALTLDDWERNGTQMAVDFGIIFWVEWLCVIFSVIMLLCK